MTVEAFNLLVSGVLHNFSFLTLLKSLFSPWRRMVMEEKGPGFNIQKFFENLSFNLISRGVGLVVRLILIAAGVVITVVVTLLGMLMVIAWVVIPPLGLPFYFKYSRRHVLFIQKLVKKLSSAKEGQARLLFDNQAGRFLANHLNLTTAIFVACATTAKSLTGLIRAQSYADLVGKFLEIGCWSDDYLRTKGVSKEDLLFGAAWWDSQKKKATEADLSFFSRRPGLGLELLYGYTPYLNQYSIDLSTPQAFSFHLIGREKVVLQMERTLEAGNSVALVGAPGVGKRTVVLEFARRAAHGQLGSEMAYKRILEFDYNSLLAGSEDINSKKTKLAGVLGEAASAGNVILMLRDIHRLTNVAVEGFDFTDVLENLLEKEDLKIIAICTTTDYERFVTPNLRLRKFLEKVEVTPPTKAEALLILRDSADNWEKRRKLVVTVQALRRILEGSDKFVTEIPFPEKALELLDAAIEYDKKEGQGIVTVDEVNFVLAEKTGISFSRLTEKEKDVLTNLETVIHEKLINQEEAVSLIAKSLRARTVGVAKEDRPIGSFLFLGPTGVGKTETAKVLARIYYGSEEAMLRFDMAQYSSNDSLERLIGSVGSGRPGDLSTAIKNRPASLLLLDEVEKASHDVHNLLLTILDEGYLVDSFGKRLNCQHLFIIGTSNAAAEFIRQQVNKGTRGDNLQKEVVEFTLRQGLFYPELLNRFDGVVVYRPLTEEHLISIAKLMFADLTDNLKAKGIKLEITKEAIAKLARDGYEPSFGARPMRRIIDLSLGDLLGRAILSGEIKEGDNIRLLPLSSKNEFKWEKI